VNVTCLELKWWYASFVSIQILLCLLATWDDLGILLWGAYLYFNLVDWTCTDEEQHIFGIFYPAVFIWVVMYTIVAYFINRIQTEEREDQSSVSTQATIA
jgi:hypothetical protein